MNEVAVAVSTFAGQPRPVQDGCGASHRRARSRFRRRAGELTSPLFNFAAATAATHTATRAPRNVGGAGITPVGGARSLPRASAHGAQYRGTHSSGRCDRANALRHVVDAPCCCRCHRCPASCRPAPRLAEHFLVRSQSQSTPFPTEKSQQLRATSPSRLIEW